MKAGTAQQLSNAILSCMAGFASFVFSLGALLYVTEFDEKLLAAIVAGAFCLLVSYIASERPNSESARALSALSERLMAVEAGDLVSPAPAPLRRAMPVLASAVDTLFAEVRASIENAHVRRAPMAKEVVARSAEPRASLRPKLEDPVDLFADRIAQLFGREASADVHGKLAPQVGEAGMHLGSH